MEGTWRVCVIVPGPFGFDKVPVLQDTFSHAEGFSTGDILMELDWMYGSPTPDKFEETVWSSVNDGCPLINSVQEYRVGVCMFIWWLERV